MLQRSSQSAAGCGQIHCRFGATGAFQMIQELALQFFRESHRFWTQATGGGAVRGAWGAVAGPLSGITPRSVPPPGVLAPVSFFGHDPSWKEGEFYRQA